MIFKGLSWTGIICCFVLYCLVFVALGYEINVDSLMQSKPRLGLLMFAIPGAVAALTSKEAPLTVALSGALLATPIVSEGLAISETDNSAFLQSLAFMTSAFFWCGSGALVVMLSRTLLGQAGPP